MKQETPILTLKKASTGSSLGFTSRTLVVYETKTLYKVELWDSSEMFWNIEGKKPLKRDKFKKKDITLEEIERQYDFTLQKNE